MEKELEPALPDPMTPASVTDKSSLNSISEALWAIQSVLEDIREGISRL